MSEKHLCIRLPELDGTRARQLISIIDAIAGELWLRYSDVIFGDAKAEVDPGPEPADEDFSDSLSDLPALRHRSPRLTRSRDQGSRPSSRSKAVRNAR